MKGIELVEKYQQIWDEFKNSNLNKSTGSNQDKLLDRGFVFEFDEGMKNIDILFIGINPSYAKGSISETHFYNKNDVETKSYFKPFNGIVKELEENKNYNKKVTWSHLDMLVFRETQQSYIESELLKTEKGVDFVYKQLMVSKKILEYLNPKIIVVSNTSARIFLGRDKFVKDKKEYGFWMNYDFEFDYELGTDKIVKNNKIKSYAFFTSMLSGQRALDKGSRQRLVWHINKVLTIP